MAAVSSLDEAEGDTSDFVWVADRDAGKLRKFSGMFGCACVDGVDGVFVGWGLGVGGCWFGLVWVGVAFDMDGGPWVLLATTF